MSQLSITANGATASSSRASASSTPASSPTAALVPPNGGSTSASPFPFGMRNTATHASSIGTNFVKHEDLPGHHLLSIRSLVASSPDKSYPETASSIADDVRFFMNNFTAEEVEDYSEVYDPDSLRSFQLATAYCLTCSEDSSEGITIPLRSASWSSWRTEASRKHRATTGIVGEPHLRTNWWHPHQRTRGQCPL